MTIEQVKTGVEVITKSGKRSVIDSVLRNPEWDGILHCCVRSIRDGKPFGPSRLVDISTLKAAD